MISQERMFELAAQATNILKPSIDRIKEHRPDAYMILEIYPVGPESHFMTVWAVAGAGDVVAWTRMNKAQSRSGILEQLQRLRARVDAYELSMRQPTAPALDANSYIEPVQDTDEDGKIVEPA